jgi:hypothetical protein
LAGGGYAWTQKNKVDTSSTTSSGMTVDPGSPGVSAKRDAAQAPPDSTGTVMFIGSPGNARITIGNEPVRAGQGIFRAGQHRYVISAPGYVARSGTVSIVADQTERVSYSLEREPVQTAQAPTTTAPVNNNPTGAQGKFRVAAEPIDAEIFIDGRLVGRGRVLDRALGAGSHQLKISAPGYETHQSSFTVEPDGTASLGKITLKPTG